MAKNTNLRTIREQLGLSQAELVRRVRELAGERFTQQSLSKLERNPDAESKYWIYIQRVLNQAGAPLDLDIADTDQLREAPGAYSTDIARIPVTGVASFDEDGYCSDLEDPAEGEAGMVWPTRDRDAYALKVDGDALGPRIKHGEYIIIEPGREPVPGDEVLAETEADGSLLCEYLYRRDGRIYFHSLNPESGQGMTSLPQDTLIRFHYIAGIVKKPIH